MYLVVQSISSTSSCSTCLLPSFLYQLAIIFRPSITSAPMALFVLFCNFTVLYPDSPMDILPPTQCCLIFSNACCNTQCYMELRLSAFVAPPLCVSQNIEEIYFPILEFLATIYPFMLLLLTYGLITLHLWDFKPIVALWKVFRRPYVQVYRAWDPKSSMIQAFASLFFLSYAKLTFLTLGAHAQRGLL